MDSTFLSKVDSKQSINDTNEAYLEQHKDSATHVHSVIRVRAALKVGAEDMRANSVKDLLETLKLDGVTIRDAEEGLRVLEEIGAGKEAREGYVAAARDRWPEATVFGER